MPQPYRDGDTVFHDEEDRFLPDVDLVHLTGSIDRTEFRETLMDRISDTLQNRCDPWKIVPTLIVSNAFSCSLTVLTLCTLAELKVQHEPDPISFGLWSYSDPDRQDDGTLYIPSSIDYTRTCRQYTDTEGGFGPQLIFLDGKFRMARACGVMAVAFGFLTMAALWMGVIRDHESTTNWRRWVGIMLFCCCFFEGMTLMVLQSGVCDSQDHGIYRDCMRGRGSNTVIIACVLWFIGGVMLVKWPRAKEYEHSTLAADEADEAKHPKPETAVEDGLFTEIWKSLEEEQDAPQQQHHHQQQPQDLEMFSLTEEVTTVASTISEPQTPKSFSNAANSDRDHHHQQPQPRPPPPPPDRSPSILDLLSPLNDEIDFCSPISKPQEAELHHSSQSTAATTTNTNTNTTSKQVAASGGGGIQPRPEPRNKAQPISLQQLREQSAIQALKSSMSSLASSSSSSAAATGDVAACASTSNTMRIGRSQVTRVSSWANRLAKSRAKEERRPERMTEHSRAALHDILASFDDM